MIKSAFRNSLNLILKGIAKKKSGLSRSLNGWAANYIRLYNDFNYDFNRNGESKIISILSKHNLKVIFDVGANVGTWSLLAKNAFPEAAIHAFELSPQTRIQLLRNVSESGIIVPPFALSAEDGRVDYKDYGQSSELSTLILPAAINDDRSPSTIQTAEVRSGDSYLDQEGINVVDFLKVDVEGAEYSVLHGFERALSTHRVRVIQFEYGYSNGDSGYLLKHLHSLLTGHGYEVGKIWTCGVRFSPFHYSMNNFDSGPNYLAVAKEESSLIAALRSRI